jgi:hypothetical protein
MQSEQISQKLIDSVIRISIATLIISVLNQSAIFAHKLSSCLEARER